MKSIEIKYPAGTDVVVMNNNNIVQTKIRAVQYSESLEQSTDSDTGQVVENVRSSVIYSTLLSPNKSLSEKDIAFTKEELVSKKFSN